MLRWVTVAASLLVVLRRPFDLLSFGVRFDVIDSSRLAVLRHGERVLCGDLAALLGGRLKCIRVNALKRDGIPFRVARDWIVLAVELGVIAYGHRLACGIDNVVAHVDSVVVRLHMDSLAMGWRG